MGYVLDTSASLYLDGLTLRIYDSNEAAGNIEAALASGNLSDWSGMVTGRAGTSLPKVATIDGVGYSSVLTANAALNGEGESEVILDRELWDKITTNKTVTVQKNDLDTIKANAQPEIIGDIVLASNFTVDGNKYIKLNADNYDDYCIEVLWYANADGEGEEAIYYPIGSTVQYIGTTLKEVENYIENGKLHNINWYTLNDDEEPVLVTEWPTVQSLDDVYYYYLDEEEPKPTLRLPTISSTTFRSMLTLRLTSSLRMQTASTKSAALSTLVFPRVLRLLTFPPTSFTRSPSPRMA